MAENYHSEMKLVLQQPCTNSLIKVNHVITVIMSRASGLTWMEPCRVEQISFELSDVKTSWLAGNSSAGKGET